MRTAASASAEQNVFSVAEIAAAAGVPTVHVLEFLKGKGLTVNSGVYVERDVAVRLVRRFRAPRAGVGSQKVGRKDAGRPLALLPDKKRRSALSLAASGSLHVALVLACIFITSLGWLDASDTEQLIKDQTPVHLVFLMTPGPGGGGGGGGLKMPDPPARVERMAPLKILRKISSPVPPVRKAPPPPRPVVVDPPKPVEPPRIEPPKIEPPKVDPPKVDPPKASATQTVQAPVVPMPADATNKAGVLNQPPAAVASAGPGTGGGAGAGAGTGMGPGRGSGIGPGSDGGIGGGPFKPGAGIEPPTLMREVKPAYTDEARRRSIEGNVLLEIVVRRDGSVGNLRVLRSLGAGLDERAADAVRQWRFGPARRQGAPVDVVVEVSVEFSLR